ncbi:class I SAM-dependent methyltransferase [Mycobacterium sp. BMJ-28]
MQTSHDDGTANGPIQRSYELNAEYWIKIVREGRDRYQTKVTDPALLAAIGDPSGLEFLDAGCGEGLFARLLLKRGANHVRGVDISPALIAAATAHPAADPKTSTFCQGDVDNLPLPDDCVDVVYANRLPHALAEPGRRFAEFARVLRPGGRFYYLSLHPCFYVPRAQRVAGPDQWAGGISSREYFAGRTIVQRFNVDGLVSPEPSVQRFYSLETHCRLVLEAGFDITGIAEPRPVASSDASDESWPEWFPTPLFLLLSCKRRD